MSQPVVYGAPPGVRDAQKRQQAEMFPRRPAAVMGLPYSSQGSVKPTTGDKASILSDVISVATRPVGHLERQKGEKASILSDVISVATRPVGPKPRTLGDFVTQKVGGSLRTLATVEPELAMSVASSSREWQAVDFAVDSGASETVIGEHVVSNVPTLPSAASSRGVKYEVANGDTIPNLGEKTLSCTTDAEGFTRHLKAQICEVSKPLMSVHRLVEAGHTVVFSPSGSYIEDGRTYERMWLKAEGGMFTVKLWVQPKPQTDAGF